MGSPLSREVYDMHDCEHPLLTVSFQSKGYQGTFDSGIAPYGLVMPASAWLCRIIYERKTLKAEVADSEGQALMQLMAACAYAPSPVMLDVTDGITHTLYTVEGKEVIKWQEINSAQAYAFQAQHLMRYSSLEDQRLVLDNASAEDQEAMRPFRQLQATSGLTEQLHSVIPFLPPEERFQAALELTHTWFHGEQEED